MERGHNLKLYEDILEVMAGFNDTLSAGIQIEGRIENNTSVMATVINSDSHFFPSRVSKHVVRGLNECAAW